MAEIMNYRHELENRQQSNAVDVDGEKDVEDDDEKIVADDQEITDPNHTNDDEEKSLDGFSVTSNVHPSEDPDTLFKISATITHMPNENEINILNVHQ
jgi:hypothetical protein